MKITVGDTYSRDYLGYRTVFRVTSISKITDTCTFLICQLLQMYTIDETAAQDNMLLIGDAYGFRTDVGANWTHVYHRESIYDELERILCCTKTTGEINEKF